MAVFEKIDSILDPHGSGKFSKEDIIELCLDA